MKEILPRPSAPLSVHIALTSKCNLKCAHCYGSFGDVPVIEQPLSTWKKIMLALKEMDVLFVNLSGGEITTYSKFDELIEYLEEIELPFYLTTNGVISNNKLKKIIKNNALIGVKISIDGLSEKSYLVIRDPILKRLSLYQTVYRTLRQLKDNNIFVEAATLIHNENLHELKEYPKVLSFYGIKKWDLGLLLPEGRGARNKDKLTSNLKGLEINQLMAEISANTAKYNISTSFGDINFSLMEKPIFVCGAGVDFMSIQSDMTVYPCPLIEYTKFNNLYGFKMKKAEDIHKVWNSEPFKAWMDQRIYGCPTCALRDKCGRCIVQLNEEGKTDPYENISACYNAKV